MCDQLEEEGIVDEGLFASVLERENIASTALSETIALPHPMKPCAYRTRVSVALLRKPIRWTAPSSANMSMYEGVDYTGARVQIALLLAMQPKDSVDVAHLYDLLIDIMADPRHPRAIAAANSFDEFLTALRNVC